MREGKKAFISLRVKIVLLYSILTIMMVGLLTVILSDNQVDLIAENTRYQARDMLVTLSRSLTDIRQSLGSEQISWDDDTLFQALQEKLANQIPSFYLADDLGNLLKVNADSTRASADSHDNIRKAVTLADFSGSDYYLKVNLDAEQMEFYYPLAAAGFANRVLVMNYDLRKVQNRYQGFFYSLFSMVILVIVLHIGVSVLIYRMIITPLIRLQKGTADLAAGHYNARLGLRRGDEIGDLADSFNHMAAEIEDAVTRLHQALEDVNEANIKLERMATVDELTGLKNRRYFNEVLRGATDKFFRYQQSFSTVLMDVDFFKKVNDTHGHEVGDMVLKEVASVLAASCRDTDVVARYGGEEFILLLYNTGLPGALQAAEKIRHALQERVVRLEDGRELKVTMSLGVSEALQIDQTDRVHFMDHLVSAADKALYKAKQNGRNRVVVYEN